MNASEHAAPAQLLGGGWFLLHFGKAAFMIAAAWGLLASCKPSSDAQRDGPTSQEQRSDRSTARSPADSGQQFPSVREGQDGKASVTLSSLRVMIDKGGESSKAFADLLEQLETEDPAAALGLVAELSDEAVIANSLRRLTFALPAESLRNVYQLAEKRFGSSRRAMNIKQGVFSRLAQIKPGEGWELLERVPPGRDRAHLLSTFIGNIPIESFSDTMNRIEALPYPEDSRSASGALARALGRSPAKDVAELLHGLPTDGTKPDTADMLARAYGRACANEERSFHDLDLPPSMGESERRLIMTSWAANSSISNPDGFVSRMEDLPLSDELKSAVYPLAIGNFASQDPQGATQWVYSNRDASTMRTAVSVAVGHWARQDSLGAANFVREQPRGPARDWGSFEIVRFLSTFPEQAEDARSWAESIEDQGVRESALALLPKD